MAVRMDNVGIVVRELDPVIDFFRDLGLELEGRRARLVSSEVVQYEDVYRLCCVRGPEDILVGLAQSVE